MEKLNVVIINGEKYKCDTPVDEKIKSEINLFWEKYKTNTQNFLYEIENYGIYLCKIEEFIIVELK